MKAIIIDDENRARVSLQLLLEEYFPEIEVVASCENLPNGVKAIRKHQPTIVFLDIQMPEYNGLEINNFLDEDEFNFNLIFTTAYQEHSIQAFKLNAKDYLLKPINPDELVESINRIKKFNDFQMSSSDGFLEKIAVPSGNNLIFIETKDIIFIKGEGAYSEIVLSGQKNILVSKNLKMFDEILESDNRFLRIQKSYIVNFDHIKSINKVNGRTIELSEDLEVPVSPEKIQLILDRIKILRK